MDESQKLLDKTEKDVKSILKLECPKENYKKDKRKKKSITFIKRNNIIQKAQIILIKN